MKARITHQEMIQADNPWKFGGVVVATTEQLPIAILARHEQDWLGAVKHVRADECGSFFHGHRQINVVGLGA